MKKFIIIAVILILIMLGVTLYLNQVLLPKKIKALIISSLSQQTGKNVTLKSLEFSFLRGLILHDLVIADGQNVLISARQGNCTIFIWPIFKKQIIIPTIHLKSPYIFLQRRADKSFNLADLFTPKIPVKKADFSVAVFKLTITNGTLVFQDESLPTKLTKEIKNITLNLALGLPVKVKFSLDAQLVGPSPVVIHALGEYKLIGQELEAQINLKDLSTQEFSAYYNDYANLLSGLIQVQAKINLKNKLLKVYLNASGDDLTYAQDNLQAKFNARLQSKVIYDLESPQLKFDGICDLSQADISGLEFLGQVKNLHGKFIFNQSSLIAESLKAELLGVPFEIKLGIKDFSTRALNLNTSFDLNILPAIAREKFKSTLITSASGKADLSVKVLPDRAGTWGASGNLELVGAQLKLDKLASPVEEIKASFDFSVQDLDWKDLKFKYQGISYKSSGTLSDFNAPHIKLKLFSDDLSLASDFTVQDKKISISQASGKYLDSQFLVSGQIDQSNPLSPELDLTGKINLELSNLNKILERSYPGISAIAPAGQLTTQFSFSGSVADFKNCALQAKSSGSDISAYGLKAMRLTAEYLQEQGVVKLPALHLDFYDGIIDGVGALNLNAKELSYQLELKGSGINLEKLIRDTPSKQKKISGTFLGEVKINGSGNDLGKLSGAGSFAVNQGRLGELNLLQGLGKLLLAKDLGSIEFSECACAFSLKNNLAFTDNLKLASSAVSLSGPLKIGFNGTLEGALDVVISSQDIPLSGTFKDVTTAIIGEGGKFGVIKLSGTLKEPKYNFEAAVSNIIQGLANVLFKKKVQN